jgi:GNAT superfamily N-acetyltransferase
LNPRIFLPETDSEIQSCYEAFLALRSHLSSESFVSQVHRQKNQGYQILALEYDGLVKSAAGFRITEFLAWGKILYIDDLTTLPEARGQSYASNLLDWLTTYAKSQACTAIHLDTGYQRHAAHRVYLKHGFELNCHHLMKSLA